MEITTFIMRFLYRIRYKIIIIPVIIMFIVAYFTQFSSKYYTVSSTVFTNISNKVLNSTQANSTSTTFDNLINITKSKDILFEVSINLFATVLTFGDPDKDNNYISSKHYNDIIENVPQNIKNLVHRDSLQLTIAALEKYYKNIPGNYLYDLFNNDDGPFSYESLKEVVIYRISNSDLINVQYTSYDAGITTNTVRIVINKMNKKYELITFKTSNDVVEYYAALVERLKNKLFLKENELSTFNKNKLIINYNEQSKALAIDLSDIDEEYDIQKKDYESSSSIINFLNSKMDAKNFLMINNRELLRHLDSLSIFNTSMTEIEIANKNSKYDNLLNLFKLKIKKEEKSISDISDTINSIQHSKEGNTIENFAEQWLSSVILQTSSSAKFKVISSRKRELEKQRLLYAGINTQLEQLNRTIKILESSYVEAVTGYNEAMENRNKLKLSTASLSIVSKADYPISSNKSKRLIYVIVSFIFSSIFITGFYLIIELIDKTLRDNERAERLTGMKVISMFTGRYQHSHRGYIKANYKASAKFTCNQLNRYLEKDKTTYINLLSINKKEGKSFIANQLKEEWENNNLKVKLLKYNEDFKIDSNYLLSKTFSSFYEGQYDIVLIEHADLKTSIPPLTLLNQAKVNLLIANSKRVWKESDNLFVKNIKEGSNTPFYLFLNNTSREAVEDFIGEIPPYSNSSSISKKIREMGLTAESSSIED